jgi:UDP-N-acetylglucosamine diphosphorylase / glucose-1-phosphate thymidylyltransferase / UDP-N-acetylgalactosamine diphosphorylase / glucosamine-1-phosphate N-acetyltransferase / galactosamine-1-phosphate N-acetyltransferase
MQLRLIEDEVKPQLYPFAQIRAVAELHVGIYTIQQRWQLISGLPTHTHPAADATTAIAVPANTLPSLYWWQQFGNDIIHQKHSGHTNTSTEHFKVLNYPWQLYEYCGWVINQDMLLRKRTGASAHLPAHVQAIHAQNIFVEEGAELSPCIINASTGPVYIGKNAVVMEGCMIRGPFCLGENAVLKMGSKIYGPVSIGAHCAAAGEIKNSVLLGWCNKAHDGYLGDSVIGEWCNLGAGTTNSNVKNTGGQVSLWHQAENKAIPVGNKAGLLMGDYSRSAINTNFNTGTVVGICCNIFGTGYPAAYVPDFTWGNQRYVLHKALEHIQNWKQFKQQTLTETEIQTLQQLYNLQQ